MYSSKICKVCGEEFIPKSSRQSCCKKSIIKICPVCGKEFYTICHIDSPTVCSKSCAAKAASLKEFTCELCGTKFHPKSSRQKYCKKPIFQVCEICGDEYETFCGDKEQHTCQKDSCKSTYIHQQYVASYKNETRICEWCGKEFTPINNTQKYCFRTHYQICKICGKKFIIDTSKQYKPVTCSKKCTYAASFSKGNPFSKFECREKAKNTMLERYGVTHPMHSAEIIGNMSKTYKLRTGYDHPSHNPEVRSRTAKSRKHSNLEERISVLLKQYSINYIHHYMLTSDQTSHEFDFYLPDYKILIDADGLYFHSYLDDPDGIRILDYYDEDRLSLIPENHIFHVIVEGQEEKSIRELVKILELMDKNLFDYEGDLFIWCRSIEFPYPQYTEKRMKSDYSSLVNYDLLHKYNPACKLGQSIIRNFHKSMYHAKVGLNPSPYDAWYDDELLKKVIKNRLIYKNDVDPAKILSGFNISKICPKVSMFNPVLAKYLINKYLFSYQEIFDPFSGFSGRLLGASSLGKKYIGQDLNTVAVNESNKIIEFLNLNNCFIIHKDILQSFGEYECMLTCPPYGTKERYNDEIVFKSCDEWISECLARFNCNVYVFVVDKTEKYSDYIVEEVKSTSHFNTKVEYVIVIHR